MVAIFLMNEDRKMSAYSYILNLYNELENLLDKLAQYSTAIKNIEKIYKDGKDIPEEETAAILQIKNDIKYFITKIKMRFEALSKTIGLDNTDLNELEKRFKEVNDKADNQTFTNFTLTANKLFVKSVINDVLNQYGVLNE